MTLALFDVLCIGLASWRLASLVVHEEGPFEVFERVRVFVGAERPGEIRGLLPKLFTCVWCFSFFTSVLMVAIYYIHVLPVMLMAAWGVAVIIEATVGFKH